MAESHPKEVTGKWIAPYVWTGLFTAAAFVATIGAGTTILAPGSLAWGFPLFATGGAILLGGGMAARSFGTAGELWIRWTRYEARLYWAPRVGLTIAAFGVAAILLALLGDMIGNQAGFGRLQWFFLGLGVFTLLAAGLAFLHLRYFSPVLATVRRGEWRDPSGSHFDLVSVEQRPANGWLMSEEETEITALDPLLVTYTKQGDPKTPTILHLTSRCSAGCGPLGVVPARTPFLLTPLVADELPASAMIATVDQGTLNRVQRPEGAATADAILRRQVLLGGIIEVLERRGRFGRRILVHRNLG